jgi:hypothetical protein
MRIRRAIKRGYNNKRSEEARVLEEKGRGSRYRRRGGNRRAVIYVYIGGGREEEEEEEKDKKQLHTTQ